MIISGWLELISGGRDTVTVDWTPEIGGASILAVITLSAYEQGYSPDFAGAAAGYIRGYTPAGGSYVSIPGDPKNNAYYITSCQSVQFRVAGNLVHVYAHAAAYQLGGPGGFLQVQHRHRNFSISHGDRLIARHRVSPLAAGSLMDVDQVLDLWRSQLAHHHGLSANAMSVDEVHETDGAGESGTGLP